MKNKFYKITLILSIILFLLIGILHFNNIQHKCKDINYAAKRYFTQGIFNKYKLAYISDLNITFSDGNTSVANISGQCTKAPYKSIYYKVFFQKNSKNIWKVKKIYTLNNID